MNDFDIGFWTGMVISILIGAFLLWFSNSMWRIEAIKNNAAQYNPTNGFFEWKANCPCVVTNK